MKKALTLLLLVIVSGMVFAGCQSSSSKTGDAGTIKAAAESLQGKTGDAKPITEKQKEEVNNKLNPAMKSIDDSLKSVDDVKDIDLSSVK